MSRLGDLQIKIQETSAGIRMLENALLRAPGSDGLLINLQSLKNVRAQLEEEFRETAANSEVDVCSYRVFRTDGMRETLTSISTTAVCSGCDAESALYATRELAADAWNRRFVESPQSVDPER